MAESYSVKAVLSAYDKGFTSAMKQANKSTESLGSKLKSGLSFGIFSGIGQQAFSMITNSAKELIGEIDSSNATWKTFDGNMKMLGKSDKEINKAKTAMQKYAQQTVYSSSDMATTYAQLSAVGIKSVNKLVTGFGGLASAAENPQQAMKTLSTQATQMAAKPKVAWADFKLMLEQTPAGIAAVAREMKMSTSELVSKVQDGKIKTTDFFNAIQKVGNNKAFSKMATEAKTVGQAMDGLKETIGNKLGPAFNILSDLGIKAVNGIADAFEGIDANAIADNISGFIEKATPYWEMFCDVASDVGSALKIVGDFLLEHSDTISAMLPYLGAALVAYKGFKVVKSLVPGMMSFTKSITGLVGKKTENLSEKLFGIAGAQEEVGKSSAKSATNIVESAKAFALMGVGVLLIAAGFAILAYSAIQLANAGGLAIGVMAGLVVGVAALGLGMGLLLKFLAPMGAQMMPVATAMMAMGAAVILVSAGFALLSYSAIQLANAGTPAIACMFGMVAAIALLAVGAALLGPALTAGAVGFLAFGAAIVLVGVGAVLAASSLYILASVLPTLVEYGFMGALAIGALGVGLVAFGAGALVAGAASLVLGAGLAVVAVGLALVGVAVLITAAGVMLLASGAVVLSAGLLACGVGVTLLAATMPIAAAGALVLSASFVALLAMSVGLSAANLVLAASFVALSASAFVGMAGIVAFGASMLVACAGVLAMNLALKGVKSSMKTISKSAKETSSSLKSMKSSISIVESGLNALGSKAKSAMKALTNAFDSTEKKAKTSGKNVGVGFSQSMQSGLLQAPIYANVASMAVAKSLNNGVGLAKTAGSNISKGFASGMLSQLSVIQSAANKMVAAADKAVRAKAKIHSPSRLFKTEGKYTGKGYGLGIKDMFGYVSKMAKKLVSIPTIETPNLQMAYAGGMSPDYDYRRNETINVTVVSNLDGREVGRGTAKYTKEELDKMEQRENRKQGLRG